MNDLSNFWYLIFHHNTAKGVYFRDENHAMFSHEKDLFSVLKRIDDRYKIDEYFEFKLTYPEEEGYIQWQQQENPLSTYSLDQSKVKKLILLA